MRWKTSRESNQVNGAPWLKSKNRTSSSESTREFSSNQQETGAGESKPNIEYSHSTGSRKLAASSPELKNMEDTNHQYMSKIFRCLRKKSGMSANNVTSSTDTYKRNVLIWECLWLRRWKPPIILGRTWSRFRKNYRNSKIRGYWELVQHYSKIGNRAFWRNSEREMPGICGTFLVEFDIGQWSIGQVGESKSMCPRWFRSMCWTDERHSNSNRKMERISGNTQVVFVLPRCSGYRWSGMFGQDFHHCLFLKKSKKRWRSEQLSQHSSQTKSSSCQCWMTLYGTQMMDIVWT